MNKKRTKFDPLSNKGTSKVFLELISGHETTKEISSTLKIKPPSVIEHLRRLQEIGVVRLGEKFGKFQKYEVDFEKFLLLFIERAIQEKKTHPSHAYPDEMHELRTLKDDKYFKAFIINYLTNQGLTATIDDSAREFEDGLLHSRTLANKKEFDDPKEQYFFNKMRKWRRIAGEKMTYAELNLQDALARTLSPERFKDDS